MLLLKGSEKNRMRETRNRILIEGMRNADTEHAKNEKKHELIANNEALVKKIAARASWGEYTKEDAYQTCVMALLKAAMQFDPEHGASFSTYASACMFHAANREKTFYIGGVYIPERRRERMQSISFDGMHEESGRRSLHETLASTAFANAETLTMARHELNRLHVLSQDIERVARKKFDDAKENKQRIVFELRVNTRSSEMKLEDVGEKIGVSKERVRQIEEAVRAYIEKKLHLDHGETKTLRARMHVLEDVLHAQRA